MRLALVSDVHGNLPALEAVLAAIAARSPDLVVSLGDVVGYGPFPGECVERLAARAPAAVAGNHDRDVLGGAPLPGTRSSARRSLAWTAERLSQGQRDLLAGLPNRWIEADAFVAVHGCYLNEEHVRGYVTSTMLPKNLAAVARRDEWPRLAFCGHTHVAMLGWLSPDGVSEPRPAAGAELAWPPSAQAVLVNPGAVGQPRDGDPRAAWAEVDLAARRLWFHRVPYDVEATIAASLRAGLPAEDAARLREGR